MLLSVLLCKIMQNDAHFVRERHNIGERLGFFGNNLFFERTALVTMLPFARKTEHGLREWSNVI